MNATEANNDSNSEYFLAKEFWFDQVGSSIFLDSLYVYLYAPLCLLGFILNMLSYFIFLKRDFQILSTFNYLRVYTISSALLCLVLGTYFVCQSHVLFQFTNSYGSMLFGCYFYGPFIATIYFFNSFMDVYISLERIFYFVPTLDIINRYSWKITCSILIVASVVINSPYFFLFKPAYFEVPLSSIELLDVYYWGTTEFYDSLFGKISLFLIYFLRDVVTLTAELIINIITIFLLKRQINKKMDIMFVNSNKIDSRKTDQIQQLDQIQCEIQCVSKKIETKKKSISKSDKNLTHMIIFMSIFSILEHVFFIISSVYILMSQDKFTFLLSFIANFFISIKHVSNFFFFILYNSLFRKAFKKAFSL